MVEREASVKIVWQEADKRPILPVSGAYGGPTPDGSAVVMHCYAEFVTPPSITSVEGGPDASTSQEVKRGDVTREIVATLVVAPEAAQAWGKWLTEKGRIAAERRDANRNRPKRKRKGQADG